MVFESLTEKLQNVFRKIKSRGKLTEVDVRNVLKEIKMALLEADVNFMVVKQFINSVQKQAVGQKIMNGLNSGHMVIKIVNEELVKLMGPDAVEIALKKENEITVIMLVGLQGVGKTMTAAKISEKLKNKGRRPLLVACDVYRPAAIKQLQLIGEKQGIEVFTMGDKIKPMDIAETAVEYARSQGMNVVIVDTAGRLHIDEKMIEELIFIRETVHVDQSILVVDAMTGQDAVNVAKIFDQKVGIDGIILTKLDGDTRGGAALSIKTICGKPIFYVGMGEKLSDLEQFYPDRMASRILGRGDMMSLIEKAQINLDKSTVKKMEQKMKKTRLDFDDYLETMNQMKKMGGIVNVLGMMPGLSGKMRDLESIVDEKALAKKEAIIYSMTPEERSNPDLLNFSRKKRIANGAGVTVVEVNRFVKQFEQTCEMMKKMPGIMKGKAEKLGGFKFPFW